MAIRELASVIQYNFDIAKDTEIHAGAPVARDSNGLVVKASRVTHKTGGAYLGLAADDTARTGNTMIIADPVGSTYLDGSGNLVANNNGLYVTAKRALGDYQAENVRNVTNPTAGASGSQGPQRGIGVYVGQGIFATDQFALVGSNAAETADTTASVTADADGGSAYAVNDLLTFGTGANAGLFVRVNSTTGNNGKVIARVDKYDSAAGLLYITML